MARCSSTPSGEVPSGSASTPALLTSTSTGPMSAANARTDDRSATSSSRELDVAGASGRRPPRPVEVADREHDLGAALGEHLGGLEADAAAGAGDDEPAAVLARDLASARCSRSGVPASLASGATPPGDSWVRPSTYATGSPSVDGPADGAEPVLDLLERARQDLARRVAVLALGEGDVEGHLELDQVVAAARRGSCGPRRGPRTSRTAPACRRCRSRSTAPQPTSAASSSSTGREVGIVAGADRRRPHRGGWSPSSGAHRSGGGRRCGGSRVSWARARLPWASACHHPERPTRPGP